MKLSRNCEVRFRNLMAIVDGTPLCSIERDYLIWYKAIFEFFPIEYKKDKLDPGCEAVQKLSSAQVAFEKALNAAILKLP